MPLYYHVYGILFNILEFMEEIKQNKMIRYYKYTGHLRNNMDEQIPYILFYCYGSVGILGK